ncbi:aryl-phospho-beta-D-glucosidase BglC (GH1 family) [Alteromonadaceae bacterium 2753L.S.0a.02]|nr:aryl-phospho-beta-D-glucosidase BglC (GH1 family) [Alteromonadaceae bacterium 2753L.S.0a.02]
MSTMRLRHYWPYLILLLLLSFTSNCFAASNASGSQKGWWNQPYPTTFDSKTLSQTMATLRVDKNRLVNDAGETVVLRGVNIGDPDKLAKNGHWRKSHFKAAKTFGANVLRIPVHPVAWQERGAKAYFELIDEAVTWANELNLYLILDWHSIGNLHTELYQHPMYETSLAETKSFWRQVSARYKGVSTIAVYEIFNEPTRYGGQLGALSWERWREINEEIIDIIYAHDQQVIPLVAGFNWAYDLSEAKKKPIRREGIAYAAHPYPTKSKAELEKKPADWDKAFGFIAKRAPVIATEIGWMRGDLPGAHIPVIDDGSYGPAIVAYLEKLGASWTVWCFDPDWPPQMISDWDYTPTEQGAFFKKEMLDRNR